MKNTLAALTLVGATTLAGTADLGCVNNPVRQGMRAGDRLQYTRHGDEVMIGANQADQAAAEFAQIPDGLGCDQVVIKVKAILQPKGARGTFVDHNCATDGFILKYPDNSTGALFVMKDSCPGQTTTSSLPGRNMVSLTASTPNPNATNLSAAKICIGQFSPNQDPKDFGIQ